MDINTFLEKSLIDQKLIDPEKLENIKQLVTKGNALADVLTDQQLIDEDSILNILSEYFGITAMRK